MVQRLIIEITKSKKTSLNGIKWVMLSLNKTKIVLNVAHVPIPKRRKSPNVVVSVSVSASSNIKTGISIMIHNFQLISKKGVLKSSTEIESESSTGQ